MTDPASRATPPLRWGVLGTGGILAGVLPAVAKLPDHVVLSVAGRSQAKAGAVASRFGLPRCHEDFASLVSDPDIDAVYVALPNSLHAEWCIRALEAGKHVLCEKPLALSVADVRALFGAARRSSRVLMEGFMYRHHPVIAETLRMVRTGVIGKIRRIECRFTSYLPPGDNYRWRPECGGGSAWDLGCYCLHFARLLAGAEPRESRSTIAWSESGVDESMRAEHVFPGGIAASWQSGFTRPGLADASIEGECGTIRLDWPWLPELARNPLRLEKEGKDESVPVPAANSYAREFLHFGACVRGVEVPLGGEEDAAGNCEGLVRLLEAGRAAA